MEIPREQFKQLEQEASLETGMQLVAQMPHGPSPFTITSLTDEMVTADFNHALAGQSLKFSVEVVELRAASEDELSHGHAHGPDGHHDH
jgi:FKBP-type peptidyl-prolyl cis-trans isomerase SlyD